MSLKGRTLPFRILVLLAYGLHPFVARERLPRGTRVRVLSGPACRRLRLPVKRFADELRYLRDLGILQDLQGARGRYEFLLPDASAWNWETLPWSPVTSDTRPVRLDVKHVPR